MLVVAVALAASCHPAAQVTTRTVTVYVPQACAADGGAYADYFALGDFDPSAPLATGHFLSDVGVALPELDTQAQALVVTATESTGPPWQGIGSVPATGDVNVLVLPAFTSCPFTAQVGSRAGSVVAPIAGQRALLVGGTGNPTPATWLAHLDTGELETVTPDLLTPRTSASVTSFVTAADQGALVAGGTSPGGTVLDTAEVFSNALGGFDQQTPITLSEPRTHQGAVVMASGQTLLVGGLGADGTTVLGSLEIVDPASGTVREEGVVQLEAPRRDPVVLRLASGEILVAGGFDQAGAPVSTLEWISPDGTGNPVNPLTLLQGPGSAFVALEAGGALAVLTPPSGAASPFQNVWVIDAGHVPQPATALATTPSAPVFFGGAGSAPVLWTGTAWLQWQPYVGAFGAFGELDDAPPAIAAVTCSPDPGMALWLDAARQQLVGLRFDTSNAYSTVTNPVLAASTTDTAPDVAPSEGLVQFDPEVGLTLGPGAGVWVTDRTYADVAIDLDAPTGEPAFVAVRDGAGNELDIGSSPACVGAVVAGAPSSIHVERHGADVTWSVAGGSSGSCALPGSEAATVRVSVGVRGTSASKSVAKNMTVERLGDP